MFESKTIQRIRWLWLGVCFFIVVLTIKFPMHQRTSEVGVWIFALTACAFLLAWFLIGVFLFSNFGLSIIKSMPIAYTNKYFKYLFFLKFFTTKEAYQEIQIFLSKAHTPRSQK